ncbi:MAG: cyanophycinase [Bacteriovoracaceae bacterium]
MARKKKGKLIIIGGREDREKDKEILRIVADHVGDGKLCIVSVASTVGDELWEEYSRAFRELGIKKLTHLDVVHRTEAIDQKAFKAVKDADAVFFTGGDQLKITSELGGTVIADRINEIFENGGVIAGTSAGASVMGEIMMVAGESDKTFRIGGNLNMAPGLGFAPKLLIDQHFAERGRIGRLLAAVAHNPRYLGIGIDEDTAIVMEESKCFRVVGNGAVYVIDAHESNGLNISEAPEDTTLSIHNVRLHLLSRDDVFDLVTKVPEKSTGAKAGALKVVS